VPSLGSRVTTVGPLPADSIRTEQTERTEPVAAPAAGARPQLAVGWLVGLMVANTVAAVGLVGDIGNHVSRGSTLTGNDFLSGWHLVLYGGVAGVAIVTGSLALVEGPTAPFRRLPAAVSGLGALAAGGLTDAWWHGVWGVERSFDALVSPPHLMIFAGLLLLMIAPIGAVAGDREAWLDWGRSAVVGASVLSLLAVISVFTLYVSPLVAGTDIGDAAFREPLPGTSPSDEVTARALAGVLWFSALVTLVVLVAQARGRPRPGTWTVTFTVLGLGPVIVNGDRAIPLTIGLLAFGVVADAGGWRGRPHPLVSGAAVAAMWAAYFTALSWRDELIWGRELWAGVIGTGLLAGTAVAGGVWWLTESSSPHRRPGSEP
jgi:hypothetical protein